MNDYGQPAPIGDDSWTWWLKAAAPLLPPFVLLLLVYWLMMSVSSAIAQVNAVTAANQRALQSHIESTEQLSEALRQAMASQLAISRQICINTAIDPSQRRECIR